MSEPKKMAILKLGPDMLRRILQLPDGVEIIRVESRIGYRNIVEVVIEGDGWLVQDGGPIPDTHGIATQEYYNPLNFVPGEPIPGAMTIDWNFPRMPK